ncbi:unnamed protein product [Clavelina lepadiformis]|uniref:Uncharacterized protein n=1 Tax=Clavelina lepadiformis TaxID=159417 RepID=A0ABP0GGI3_CLALP
MKKDLLSNPLPSYIYFGSLKLYVNFEGQKKACSYCEATGHLFNPRMHNRGQNDPNGLKSTHNDNSKREMHHGALVFARITTNLATKPPTKHHSHPCKNNMMIHKRSHRYNSQPR